MRSGELVQNSTILFGDGHHFPTIRLPEIGRQINKICDGYGPVGIDIAFLPRFSGGIEVGGKGDEIGDGDIIIEVQVANEGRPDGRMKMCGCPNASGTVAIPTRTLG
jgi:hypothetical protein